MRSLLFALALILLAAPLAAFDPPACDGSEYSDVPQASDFCPWIKQLKLDQITEGCGGGNYCAQNAVTRQQLAVMLGRLAHGTDTFKIDAGTLDGLDSSQFQKKYAKVANVAASGGDYTSPSTAVANLATWCGVPSSGNPCLIMVWPGFYILGGALIVPSFVDLAGAGINMTTLYRSGGAVSETPVVIAQGSGEIRDLTIATNGGDHSMGLLANDGSQRRIRRAQIFATTSAVGTIGVRVTNGSNVTLEHCQVAANTAPTTKALEVANGTPSKATTYGTSMNAGSSVGGVCVGVDVTSGHSVEMYDSYFGASSCGTGIGIRAAVNGIWRGGYSVVSGSTVKNIAFQQVAGSSGFLIQGVMMQAFGADASALALEAGTNLSVFASALYGEDQSVKLSGNSDVFVDNSVLAFGGLVTTVAGDGFFIGNSVLWGVPSGPGTFQCVGSHDTGYDPVLPNCT